MMYVPRRLQESIQTALAEQAGVVLLGPRQVGKTTLALRIARERDTVYFDLENPETIPVLADPKAVLAAHEDQLVVLDEVQRLPGLFPTLRGVIDRYRRKGLGVGHFLLLGSSSPDLLRQSAESLAGRVAYRELGSIDAGEVGVAATDSLWLRGGFPGSFLAATTRPAGGSTSRTYLERDIPTFESVAASTLRRLWTMLVRRRRTSRVSRPSLGINVKTPEPLHRPARGSASLRRLQPWSGNVRKRLVRSPRLYLRDSGIVHALLGLRTLEDVLSTRSRGRAGRGSSSRTSFPSCRPGSSRSTFGPRPAPKSTWYWSSARPGAGPWRSSVRPAGCAPQGASTSPATTCGLSGGSWSTEAPRPSRSRAVWRHCRFVR